MEDRARHINGWAPLLLCYIYHMTTINPWVNFNGNAEEAFTFYKSVFGGEFAKVIRFEDTHKIMHIALPIGKNNMLIANDVPEIMGKVNEN